MIAAVVGCGRWGERVARRLAALEGVTIGAVFDADMERARSVAASLPAWPNGGRTSALDSFANYLDVCTPDAVVLAVPPGERMPYVEAVCRQHEARRPRLRIEKPLAMTVDEAERIVELCADAGVDLTVGFTLLHHPLYDAVFGLIERQREVVTRVEALRIGRAPAHDVDAMLDIGIHAASIAAYFDPLVGGSQIVAHYHDAADARTTRIELVPDESIVVDELALTATTPYGSIVVGDTHDALGCDLQAWIDGTHRGTPDVALKAQRIIEYRNAYRQAVAA